MEENHWKETLELEKSRKITKYKKECLENEKKEISPLRSEDQFQTQRQTT